MTIGQYEKAGESKKDKEDWVCDIERIMLFFEANEISEDSKKRALLVSSVETKTYKVIKSLAMPKKPAEKSFKEIADFSKEHQIHKPNTIAKPFKFDMNDRKEGELLSEYLAEFRC